MSATSPLAGRRIVVSAGPTFEDIDPVRFIGNRSSGKMGFAIAGAAAQRGAEVVLVAGPVSLPTPAGVGRINVRSAAQMHATVLGALPADVYIGAAAVADYTPRQMAAGKIKKQPGQDTLVLELVRTADVLADVAAHPLRPRLVVGFAAETHDVAHYARGKLVNKKVDLIAANRVGVEGSGFESDDNALVVYAADGETALGPAPKPQLADELLDLVAARLAEA
ncbi:phosphopantothenoylcysteine decarboxylase/phosphopantothenate--cysteine ligase [Lysobacter ruishenii]|uniref:Phosphopantothenoylcysteine decarboxylase/phosphopantothenate--cysteine ligase n=1 Tax=Aerolutibacter ruishenii TaxID=686800 RepID=A0A562M1A4_9GAMM|nr:phosphopantothenoylcysteine decarboxylase/phosphopantothenate--cysteine ligase [Lysobacter ruishenii]